MQIGETTNVQHNIVEVIQERLMRWYGHFERIVSDEIPKIILKWNVEGRQREGRASEQRTGEIKRSIISRDPTEEDAEDW